MDGGRISDVLVTTTPYYTTLHHDHQCDVILYALEYTCSTGDKLYGQKGEGGRV